VGPGAVRGRPPHPPCRRPLARRRVAGARRRWPRGWANAL